MTFPFNSKHIVSEHIISNQNISYQNICFQFITCYTRTCWFHVISCHSHHHHHHHHHHHRHHHHQRHHDQQQKQQHHQHHALGVHITSQDLSFSPLHHSSPSHQSWLFHHELNPPLLEAFRGRPYLTPNRSARCPKGLENCGQVGCWSAHGRTVGGDPFQQNHRAWDELCVREKSIATWRFRFDNLVLKSGNLMQFVEYFFSDCYMLEIWCSIEDGLNLVMSNCLHVYG